MEVLEKENKKNSKKNVKSWTDIKINKQSNNEKAEVNDDDDDDDDDSSDVVIVAVAVVDADVCCVSSSSIFCTNTGTTVGNGLQVTRSPTS